MVFLNAQSSGQCWKRTFKILSWHVIVLMYCTWILFSKTCWLTMLWKVMNDGKNLFLWLFKTNVKTGSIFYEPFVISSISSSTLAVCLFLPGTWPVLNNISSLCTSSRERALAIAALIAAMSLVGCWRGLLGAGLVPTGGPPGTNVFAFFAFWLSFLTLFTTEHSFGSLSFPLFYPLKVQHSYLRQFVDYI